MRRFVSDHAVMRWCERVFRLRDRIDRVVGPDAGDPRRAMIGCSMLGIDVEEARLRILPPWLLQRMCAGLAMKASAIKRSGYRLVIVEGHVVTVTVNETTGRPRMRGGRKWYSSLPSSRQPAASSIDVARLSHRDEAA